MSTGGNQNADSSWYPIGQTLHTVYVTLKDPKTPLRQESLFYISCNAADTEDKMNNVPERVWTGFEGRNVCRVDGEQLTYYKKYDNGVISIDGLLAEADGQCGAWTYLFIRALQIQGFQLGRDAIVGIVPKNSIDTGFMIKNWEFTEPGIVGTYPYMNISVTAPPYNDQKNGYAWFYEEVADINGIPGQGGIDNPRSLFDNHFVAYVTVNGIGKYYDPSYGKRYDAGNLGVFALQFNEFAIQGFYKVENTYEYWFRKKPYTRIEIEVRQ